MNFAAPKATRRRRTATAGLAAAALLGATGCSATNQPATTMVYSPSDGIVEDVGEAELSNLMLITTAPDSEGRYLGTVNNISADEPLEVVITVEGTSTNLTIPAGEEVALDYPEHEHIIPTTGTFPGGLAEGTVQVGDQTEQVQIPVLDGTLPEYREYVPGGFDPSTIEHLYNTPEPAGH